MKQKSKSLTILLVVLLLVSSLTFLVPKVLAATPAIVQGPFRTQSSINSGTFTITVTGTPATTSTMILCFNSEGQTTNANITGISSTNTVWASASSSANPSGLNGNSEIWYTSSISASAGKTITVTVANGAGGNVITAEVIEWSGIASSPVDKTVRNDADSATGSTGATATTTQANELAVASIGGQTDSTSSTNTISSPTNSFTLVNGTAWNSPIYNALGYCYKAISSTGNINVSVTFAHSSYFGASLATFKASSTNWPVAASASWTTAFSVQTVWGAIIGLSQSITSSYNAVVGWASIVKPTLAFGTSWNVLTQWGSHVGATQGITAGFNGASGWSAIVSATQGISSSWNAVSKWGSNINLAQSIGSSWNSLAVWSSQIGLSTSFSTSWNVLTQWSSNINLAQSIGSSWNAVVAWTANIGLTQTINSVWSAIVSSVHASADWPVSLSASLGSSWNVLTQWTSNINLSQSIGSTWNALSRWGTAIGNSVSLNAGFSGLSSWASHINLTGSLTSSWNVLTKWSAHVGASLTINSIWSIDVPATIHDFFINCYVSLNTTWNIVVDHFGLINDNATGDFGLFIALALLGAPVIAIVSWVMFTQSRKNGKQEFKKHR